MILPEYIFKIHEPTFVIETYYLVGISRHDSYAIYCNQAGHIPHRVHIKELMGKENNSSYFLSKESASDKAHKKAKDSFEFTQNQLIKLNAQK